MKYMGSKNRIAKEILPIMLKNRNGMDWVEPFVGGGNMIDKVDGRRIGYDANKYAIQALISIRDYLDYLPKNNLEFNEFDYKNLRLSDEYKHKGYAGFAFSYGGKWMGGWSRNKTKSRDYVNESYRNAQRQSVALQGCFFVCKPYNYIDISHPSLIYCDPPYAGTTGYKNSFNHEDFWNWCREKTSDGHLVFISEYNAPDDFISIYEKKITSSLTSDTGGKFGTEKLFVHSSIYDKIIK